MTSHNNPEFEAGAVAINKSKRNEIIDLIKGFAMMIVVARHAGLQWGGVFSLFHMQIFFMASGYFWRDNVTENMQNMIVFVKKRIKSLYIPCVLWSVTVTLLHNFLVSHYLIGGGSYDVKKYVVQIIKCVLFSGGGELLGTIWFLRTMFFSLMIYLIIDKVSRRFNGLRKDVFRFVCCGVLLVAAWVPSLFNANSKYLNIFAIVILYEVGRQLRHTRRFSLEQNDKSRSSLTISCIGVTVSGLLLIFLHHFGSISVNSNILGNPVFFLVCSLLGWSFLLFLSQLTVCVKGVRSVISVIGRNTMPIMLFHFASFKAVTLMQIIIYGLDIKQLTAYPYLDTAGVWWLIYTLAGCGIPLLAAFCFHKISCKIVSLRTV